jgi:hypothetical protein
LKPSSKEGKDGPENQFKSFKVTLDDPCWKVLPAALKKYRINDDWQQYAMFICYGNTGMYMPSARATSSYILFQQIDA